MEATLLAVEKKRTKRRGNSEGSIYQHTKSGRWIGMLSLGYGDDGKRKRRAIYGDTKREVQEQLRKFQHANEQGMLCEISVLTVSAYLRDWLKNKSASGKLADTTLSNYRSVIENHIVPGSIGGLRLQKLNPMAVQRFYTELENAGVGSHARLMIHIVLNAAIDRAIKLSLIPRNVCKGVERPEACKADIQPLTAEQVGTLLATARGTRLESLYGVAVGTGLRLGELFGLQWADVDLDKGTLSVRHTLQELSGKLTLKEPKTKTSNRNVELSEMAITALVDHRRRMMAEGNAASPWVFCNQHGTPLRRSHFHRAEFKPLLKRAGLPDIHFHALRHTMATLMLAAGVNVKVIQERLGHSKVGITLDTYSHVVPGMGRDAASKLDSMLTMAAKRATVAIA